MSTVQGVEAGLRQALPAGYADESVAELARLIDDLSRRTISEAQAAQRLRASPALMALVGSLAGAQVPAAQGLVSFAQDSSVGDVRIGTVAGGNVINITVNAAPERRRRAPRLAWAALAGAALLLVAGITFAIGGRQPPAAPQSLEERLLNANIIPSDDPQEAAEIRRHLASTESGIITLANNCLDVLDGRRLKEPVALTTINSAYKIRLGRDPNASLRYAEYGDRAALEAAMYDAWKLRNGNSSTANMQLTSFAEIVQR